jgi:hypothetical protein
VLIKPGGGIVAGLEIQASSSIGRATVSKTVGCGFDSCLACLDKGTPSHAVFDGTVFSSVEVSIDKEKQIGVETNGRQKERRERDCSVCAGNLVRVEKGLMAYSN